MQKILSIMTKKEILPAFTKKISCGIVEKILEYYGLGHAFESRAPTFFYFPIEILLRYNLNFSTSYGRSTDL